MLKLLSKLTSTVVTFWHRPCSPDDTQNLAQADNMEDQPYMNLRYLDKNSVDRQAIKHCLDQTQRALRHGNMNNFKAALHQYTGSVADVINLRDVSGYNLLQHAIIANRLAMVEYLVGQGGDLNAPICGRPLHLAAKLGYPVLVSRLLELGADSEVRSCVCYPKPHVMEKYLFEAATDFWTISCAGDIYNPRQKTLGVVYEYPMYFAIKADSVPCVQLFVQCHSAQLAVNHSKLHIACLHGAQKCAEFFLRDAPYLINHVDDLGITPIEYACGWGKDFTEFLVLQGASVSVHNHFQGGLLSTVYMRKLCPGLFDLSRYLLSCGLNKQVNSVDISGRSPLHFLLASCVDVFADPSLHDDRQHDITMGPHDSEQHWTMTSTECLSYLNGDQSLLGVADLCQTIHGLTAAEREIYLTIKLLLDAGANPFLCDQSGLTPLHSLCELRGLNLHKSDISYRLMLLILRTCLAAAPTTMSPMVTELLHVFVQTGCHHLLIRTRKGVCTTLSLAAKEKPACAELDSFLQCIMLMCSFVEDKTLFAARNRCLIYDTVKEMEHIRSALLPSLDEEGQVNGIGLVCTVIRVISTLLDCGYPLPLTRLGRERGPHITTEMSRLPLPQLPLLFSVLLQGWNSPCILDCLHEATLLLLLHQHSAPGEYFYMQQHDIVCVMDHSTHVSLLFRIIEQLAMDMSQGNDNGRIHKLRQIFDILFNYMDINEARDWIVSILDSLKEYLQSHLPTLSDETKSKVEAHLLAYIKHPRRLQQLAANRVFIVVCHRSKRAVLNVQIPQTMKDYLLSLQY